jgi:hypothetical protein
MNEMDIITLTEASTGALRKKDPFMYYSAFKPTGNPAREAASRKSCRRDAKKWQ